MEAGRARQLGFGRERAQRDRCDVAADRSPDFPRGREFGAIVGAVAVLTLVHEAIYDVFARPAGLWPMITYAIARAAYNGGLAVVVGAGLRRARRLLPPEEVGA